MCEDIVQGIIRSRFPVVRLVRKWNFFGEITKRNKQIRFDGSKIDGIQFQVSKSSLLFVIKPEFFFANSLFLSMKWTDVEKQNRRRRDECIIPWETFASKVTFSVE